VSNYYDDTPDMVAVSDVEPLARELTERRLADWRKNALEKFPHIAPMLDLIQGSSEENVMATAEDLGNRLASAGAGVATPTAYQGPPVNAGSLALPPAPKDAEEMEDLKRRARSGDERAGAGALHRLANAPAGGGNASGYHR